MTAQYPTNVELHRWAEQQPWGHKVHRNSISRDLVRAWDRAHPDRPYVKSQAHHGTQGGYQRGCRCEACTAAATAVVAGYVRNRNEDPDTQIPHGTSNGYKNYGCRCDDCRSAATAQRRHERAAAKS